MTGIARDGRQLGKVDYDSLSDDEKFKRFGTTSWAKVDKQLSDISKKGERQVFVDMCAQLKGDTQSSQQQIHVIETEKAEDIEYTAKKIASKIIKDSPLVESEHAFIAENAELVKQQIEKL